MDKLVYDEMAVTQDSHWWYRGRRSIIYWVLSSMVGGRNNAILELGCGPGGNLAMLKSFGSVTAVEMDKNARNYAKAISSVEVHDGYLPDNLPEKVLTENYNIIGLFDVLEHIEHDDIALKKIFDMLPQEGNLLLTVPAFQFLFGPHDVINHHYRRYNKRQIKELLENAGFKIKSISYFNFWLFPLALISRLIDLLSKNDRPMGTATPRSFINTLFFRIFSSEKFLLRILSPPFGVSIYALASKS